MFWVRYQGALIAAFANHLTLSAEQMAQSHIEWCYNEGGYPLGDLVLETPTGRRMTGRVEEGEIRFA